MTNEDGLLPLHCALRTEEDRSDTVRLLISAGASVNEPNSEGEHPVFSVLNGYEGSIPLLRTLLEFKPDLSAKHPETKELPLPYAEERGLSEHAALLRGAGAPEPECRPPEPRTVSIKHPETGKTITVTIKVIGRSKRTENNSSADAAHAEKADYDEAERITTIADSMLPGCWEASPGHWNILEGLRRMDLTLERCAYFARGFLNAPLGKDLADWHAILGETYISAVNRHIELGLVEIVSVREAISATVNTARIKAALKSLGVKRAGTTKAELLSTLFAAVGDENLSAYVQWDPLYRITELGKTTLARREEKIQAILAAIGKELLEHVTGGSEESAKVTVLRLRRICRNTRSQRGLSGDHIRKFQNVWAAQIPTELEGSGADLGLVRTWLLFIALDILSTNSWPADFGIPKLSLEILPWEFYGRIMNPEDRTADFEEGD